MRVRAPHVRVHRVRGAPMRKHLSINSVAAGAAICALEERLREAGAGPETIARYALAVWDACMREDDVTEAEGADDDRSPEAAEHGGAR